MPDLARGAADNETPVNPYSLLEAVNSSSDTAHMAWLIFIGVMAYLMVAVAGVTHKDLLLETPVALPILQVNIQLTQFFQFAPVLLVLFHMGLVSQLVLLARKTLEFDGAVRALEVSDRRSHPLRLELHNFFFVQAIAGPHRSVVMSAFLHGMSWLTLVFLPLFLLLYIQITFLPYHGVAITWTHRIALLADVAMLVLIGIFLTRTEASFLQAFGRTTLSHPISFFLTATVVLLVTLFSLTVVTIPGEPLDRVTRMLRGPELAQGNARKPQLATGFALPFISSSTDGSLLGVFHRNLIVTDLDLVPDRDGGPAEDASINLRDRDLRYAKLDRSDLHRADFTGADLTGASLIATDLRAARLTCADINELVLTENRPSARCAAARGADFTRAMLAGARMAGVDLTTARLEEANLESAELAYAVLAGAHFASAHLEKADMTGGVEMQGANFIVANLQGADLTGALAQGADFSSAAMQGAVLSYAGLQGASLKDADLEGADLNRTWLLGTDLSGAKLRATDLRGSGIWFTAPAQSDNLTMADLADLVIAPPEDWMITELRSALDKIDDDRIKARVTQAVQPILGGEARKWSGSSAQQFWQTQAAATAPTTASEPYRAQLSEYLGRLMCRAKWGNGAVATGVAKRSQAPYFRGDMTMIYDRLRAKECPAAETVAKKAMRDLATAVDNIRSQ